MRRLALSTLGLGLALALAGCGNGGSSGTGGTGGGGGSSNACDEESISVTGSLDGSMVSVKDGVEHGLLDGSQGADMFSCGGGDLLMTPDASLVRMPKGAPHAGEWYCAGQGSTVSVPSTGPLATASLTAFSKLGACPGAAASDMLTGCLDPTGMSACLGGVSDALSGTLGGAMINRSGEGVTSLLTTGVEPGTLDLIYPGGSRLVLEIEGDPDDDDLDLKITGGILATGMEGPDPGAVYCIGSGTIDLASPATFSIGSLTRLGACGATPVDGALMVTVTQATSK